MKKFLLIFCLSALLAAGCNQNAAAPGPYSRKLQVGNKTLMVEVVDTVEKLQLGLSGREKLENNQAMLFDFAKTNQTTPAFWMKDMKFGLDFIWIKNGKIVGLTQSVAPPRSASESLPTYVAPGPVDKVLEVNSGWSKQNNIKEGDEARLLN